MESTAAIEAPGAPEPPDPWNSALWSQLVPGLGQVRLGARTAGLAFLAVWAAGIALTCGAFVVRAVPMSASAVGLPLAVGAAVLAIVDAHRRAGRNAGAPGASAWRAAFWNRSIPGLGQLLERRWLAGILFLAGLLLASSFQDSVLGGFAFGLFVLFAIGEGWVHSRSARTLRAQESVVAGVIVVLTLAQTLVPALLRTSVIRAFRLPSDSMAPTLRRGDAFFVDLTRAGRADAGELIVFRFPQNPSQDFCKRCVGVAGQTVEIVDKRLRVDGVERDEPFATHTEPDVRPAGGDPRDNFGPYLVPAGYVFVLGDNRDNSNDSRFWGPLPLRLVRGRVGKIYWPPSRWSFDPAASLPRQDARTSHGS